MLENSTDYSKSVMEKAVHKAIRRRDHRLRAAARIRPGMPRRKAEKITITSLSCADPDTISPASKSPFGGFFDGHWVD
jgi:hypothetical protein